MIKTFLYVAVFLLGGNGDALLSEVLGSAGVIGNGGDRGGELQAQLVLLVVSQTVDILEDTGDHVIDVVFLDVVVGNDDSAHSNGGSVSVQTVSGGGDDVLGVVGGSGDQLLDCRP